MKPIRIQLSIACMVALIAANAIWAGEVVPENTGPGKTGLTENRDAEFLSAMIASYEVTALTAQPLVDASKSMPMRIMADERVRTMKKFSRRITKLLEEKGWRFDPSFRTVAGERISALMKLYGASGGEMNLLSALEEYHVETAKAALDAMGRTRDVDVADMAKRIVSDQIESIVAAKKMPEMIALEKRLLEGGFDPYTDPNAVNPLR